MAGCIANMTRIKSRQYFVQGICLYSTSRNKPLLTMYTKPDCQLCEEAKEQLEPYMQKVNYSEVDISKEENTFWKSRYRYEIPVFHFNGRFLMKHRVDFNKLKDAIHLFTSENETCK